MRSALLLALTSCTAIADFPASALTEDTAALCGNGVDDDDDGLSDCQDWKCLAQPACCTIPSLILEDSFDSQHCDSTTCAEQDRTCEPDPERWQRWGEPQPYLCEDALAIGKDYAGCYPVGVMSRAAVALDPGLHVEARVSGVPELAGRLDVGLTLQDAVTDGDEACSPVATVPTLAAIVFTAGDGGGVRFLATIGGVAIAELAAEAGAHRIAIEVTPASTLRFTVDEIELATTGDPLPALGFVAHVVAHGLGVAARLDHLRVVAGTQCAAPDGWTPAATATPLDPPPEDAWDDFERATPNAVIDADDRLHLFYQGCRRGPGGRCDALTIALGDAIAPAGGAMVRPTAPVTTSDVVLPVNFERVPVDAHVLIDEGVAYFGTDGWPHRGIYRCEPFLPTDVAIQGSRVTVIEASDDGWDDDVCCPVIVDHDGRRMYFASRGDDGVSRIGLALALGDAFVKHPDPVVEPGGEDAFDELGVTQPWVIWDDAVGLYRMWYTAISEIGTTSVGYAVSIDGIVWHKFDRSVIEPRDLDLLEIGSPTVVDDGGRLRMWIDGLAPGAVAKTIYELENLGSAPP